ncbi:hypothetical protein VZC37_19775 [Gordonia sp. LSe1-13]|uniref:Transmembrane protein n=1 Tax=Gordonia sesuvii TaxID=3116777 RepID=A0ABU7MHR7_9ACTN|nr:hypothetical protein [Gordonia sp. LSe1-13]
MAFAVTATRRRPLWWLIAIPAVLGGAAAGSAVPFVLVTRDVDMTVLFPGVAGMAIWFVVVGIVLARRSDKATTPPPVHADLAVA